MQNPIAVEYHERGEVRPTLVVGLGGSGVYTARRLKRLIHERYNTGGLIRFLYVDTDQGQFQHEPLLADVEPDETVQLAIAHPEQIVDEWRRKPELHPYLEFLNGDVNVGLLRNADGAAGIRPIGRFGFHASFDSVYPRLQQAVQQIMQVEEQVRALMATVRYSVEVVSSQPRVYIIASLCGGTGSGIYFDTALVLREILLKQNLDGELVGIFYLPSVFQNEAGISRSMREVIEANAYAALMELEHFCNSNNLHRENWEVKYRMIPPIALKEPLVDEAYVVESANAAGRALGSKYEVFEMVARSVLMDIGSPLGARARSAKRNSLAVIDAVRCPETGEPRLLSSLAVASLAVPIRELTEYCCLRIALDRLQEKFSGNQYPDWHTEAERFLQNNGLTAQSIQKAFLEVASTARVAFRDDNLAAEIDRAQRQEQQLLQNINATASRVRAEFVQKASVELEERCRTLREQHGIAGVQGFLEALEEQVRAESDSVLRELKERGDHAPAWDALREQARKEPHFLKSLVQRDANEQHRREIDRRARLRMEYISSREVLNQAAQILGADSESIVAVVQAMRRQQAHETQSTKQIVEAIRERLNEIEHGQPAGTTYPLEQLACLKHHFRRFYETHKSAFTDPIQVSVSGSTVHLVFPNGRGKSRSYTVADMRELLNRLVEGMAEHLAEAIRERANVMEFLKPVYDDHARDDSDDKVYLERKVEYLLGIAKPFWSAAQPPGDARFEEFIAVSVPLSPEDYQRDEEARRLDEAVEKLTQRAGVSCERVRDGYPFALTVLNRTYGARAYYLRGVAVMEHTYRRRASNPQVRAHLHLDARFAQLPMLTPPDPDASRLWVAAVNMGYVAEIDGKFYFGIETLQRQGAPRPKYQTQRTPRLVLPDATGDDPLQGSYAVAEREALLGETYDAARRAFLNDAQLQDEVRDALTRVAQHIGRELLIDALKQHADQLLDEANRAQGAAAQRWREEREALLAAAHTLEEESYVLSYDGRRSW